MVNGTAGEKKKTLIEVFNFHNLQMQKQIGKGILYIDNRSILMQCFSILLQITENQTFVSSSRALGKVGIELKFTNFRRPSEKMPVYFTTDQLWETISYG